MVRARDLEVGITRKIVGKESGAALKGHHHSANGKELKLCLGKAALCALDKALNVKLVEGDVEVDLGEVGLILKSGGRAEANGVTEVVYGSK